MSKSRDAGNTTAESEMSRPGVDEVDGMKIVSYSDDRKTKLQFRLRRTKSVARAEEITQEAEKVRRSQPDKP